MSESRREALIRYLARDDAERVEVSLSPRAMDALRALASFGVSGDAPEVRNFYASRLLEVALEDLGDDPVERIQTMPPRESKAPKPGEPAPDAVLLGDGGEPVHLHDQWSEQTALLVFLRHYG